jgi:uncharacterized protein YaaW (UPF0174 family)
MASLEKLDRDTVKNMSPEQIRQLVHELRLRSDSLNEELRVLQDQIRASNVREFRGQKRGGI